MPLNQFAYICSPCFGVKTNHQDGATYMCLSDIALYMRAKGLQSLNTSFKFVHDHPEAEAGTADSPFFALDKNFETFRVECENNNQENSVSINFSKIDQKNLFVFKFSVSKLEQKLPASMGTQTDEEVKEEVPLAEVKETETQTENLDLESERQAIGYYSHVYNTHINAIKNYNDFQLLQMERMQLTVDGDFQNTDFGCISFPHFLAQTKTLRESLQKYQAAIACSIQSMELFLKTQVTQLKIKADDFSTRLEN